MKISTMILLAALMLPVPAISLAADADTGSAPHIAKVGEPAPPFALDALVGTQPGKEFKKITLNELRGKWVVLFFYPMDFTFVCPTEIKGFNEALPEFSKLNAVLLGASTDSKYSHLAWVQRGDLGALKYPLLSDLKKETATSYGCLDDIEYA